jgi:hypothetical protein
MGDAFLRWVERRWLIGHSKGYGMRRLAAVFGSDILPVGGWDPGPSSSGSKSTAPSSLRPKAD